MVESLGKKIKRKRLELHLTQAELAEMVGVSQRAISRIESDKEQDMMLSTANGLSKAFNCNIQWLLGD